MTYTYINGHEDVTKCIVIRCKYIQRRHQLPTETQPSLPSDEAQSDYGHVVSLPSTLNILKTQGQNGTMTTSKADKAVLLRPLSAQVHSEGLNENQLRVMCKI